MKLEKNKIVLDFDDTLVKSSEQIIRMLNERYGLNKSIKDLTDWSYTSIYPRISIKEITELYASPQFFEQVHWNDSALKFILWFRDEYHFIICSKGSKENLRQKERFLSTWFFTVRFISS